MSARINSIAAIIKDMTFIEMKSFSEGLKTYFEECDPDSVMDWCEMLQSWAEGELG